jgi:hypothetical protein
MTRKQLEGVIETLRNINSTPSQLECQIIDLIFELQEMLTDGKFEDEPTGGVNI